MAKKNKKADSGKLSKADRKKLEKRERKIMAELADRAEGVGVDVSGLKRKALKALVENGSKPERKAAKAELARRDAEPEQPTPTPQTQAEREAKSPTKAKKSAKAEVDEAADKVLAEPGSEGAHADAKIAKAAAAEASEAESTDDIKARLRAKKARRAELDSDDYRDAIDLDDHEAVKAYNAEAAELGLGRFLTSNAERDASDLRVQGDERPMRELIDEANAKRGGKPSAADDALATAHFEKDDDATEQTVTEVETERGRVFAAGADDLAKPSEATRDDFELNGNGQYKVRPPGAKEGTEKGYTRVTTYIDNLESRAKLEEWKRRLLLEGVALNDTPEGVEPLPEPIVSRVRQLIHQREVAIAKARKADRKGKLELGELATYVNAANRDYKDAVNKLAESMLELGGARERAERGTDLHGLFERFDESGLEVDAFIEADREEGTITPADIADLRAYDAAVKAAGIKWLPECTERPIVIDELGVAGRMDRAGLVRFKDAQRAVRAVVDIKTGDLRIDDYGKIEFGAGKIAQQLGLYSRGIGYDLDTHERTDLKLDKKRALVIHVPAGSGEAHIYEVDLVLGAKGNKLSGEVRAWRNESKRAIVTDYDYAHPEVVPPWVTKREEREAAAAERKAKAEAAAAAKAEKAAAKAASA